MESKESINNKISKLIDEKKIIDDVLNNNLQQLLNVYKCSDYSKSYYLRYNQTHMQVYEKLGDVFKLYDKKIDQLNDILVHEHNLIKHTKQTANMLNNLVVNDRGTYFLPFLDDKHNVMIAVFMIKKIDGDNIIDFKLHHAVKGKFESNKHFQYTTIPFFKEMKELKKKLNGKNSTDVHLIAPQLFYQIYNTKIKQYEQR